MKLKSKLINIIIIALIIIAIVIFAIISFFSKDNEQIESDDIIGQSKFENMQVYDTKMKYDEENNQTFLTFNIKNISEEEIVDKKININALNESGVALTINPITISSLKANEDYYGEIIIVGNLIEKIKTLEIEDPEKVEETEPTE